MSAAAVDARAGRRVVVAASTRWVLSVVALSRLFAALFVYLGQARAGGSNSAAGDSVVRSEWLRPWSFYDGQWYLAISGRGYEVTSSVFSPLYPMLLRLAGPDADHRALFGIGFSTVAFAGACVLLHQLTAAAFGNGSARVAVLVLAFHPLGAVWSSLYTESLALLLLVATWSFVRRGEWAMAFGPALLLGWTRNIGAVLAAALFVEWVAQRRRAHGTTWRSTWVDRRALVGLATVGAPLVGFLGFLLWVRSSLGGGAGVEAQRRFGRAWDLPYRPLLHDIGGLFTRPVTIGGALSVFAIISALGFAFAHRRRMPMAYPVLVLGVLAMHLTLARIGEPRTIGAARYVMLTFPWTQSVALTLQSASPTTRRALAAVGLVLSAFGAFAVGRGQFELG